MELFTLVQDPNNKEQLDHIKNILRYTLLIDMESGLKEVRDFNGTDQEKLSNIWEVCRKICFSYSIPFDFFGYNREMIKKDKITSAVDTFAFKEDELTQDFKKHCIFMTYLTLRLTQNREMISLKELYDQYYHSYYTTISDKGGLQPSLDDIYQTIDSIIQNGLHTYLGLSEDNKTLVSSNYKYFVLNLIHQWLKCPYNPDATREEDKDKILPHCFLQTIKSFYTYYTNTAKKLKSKDDFKELTEDTILDMLVDYYMNERIFNANTLSAVSQALSKIKMEFPDSFQGNLADMFSCFSFLPNIFSRTKYVENASSALGFTHIAYNTFLKEELDNFKVEIQCYKIKNCSTETERYNMWIKLLNDFISYTYAYSFPVFERCFFLLYLECFGTSIQPASNYIINNISEYKMDTTYLITSSKHHHGSNLRNCMIKLYPLFKDADNYQTIFDFNRFALTDYQQGIRQTSMKDSDDKLKYRNEYTLMRMQSLRNDFISFDKRLRDLFTQ